MHSWVMRAVLPEEPAAGHLHGGVCEGADPEKATVELNGHDAGNVGHGQGKPTACRDLLYSEPQFILLAVAKNRITQGSTTVQRHAACAVMWDGQACGLRKLYQRSVTLDVPVSAPGGVCTSRARRPARKSGVDHDRGYRISPQHLLYLPDGGSILDLLVSLRKLFSPSPRFCTRLRLYDNY